MTERIANIEREATSAIAQAGSTQALEDVRIRYLGRKARAAQPPARRRPAPA